MYSIHRRPMYVKEKGSHTVACPHLCSAPIVLGLATGCWMERDKIGLVSHGTPV